MTDTVRAARRGDRAAFERLVRTYASTVTAITLAVTGDPIAAQDLAQDAFLRAWRMLDTLEDPAAFGAWLSQIARNLARDQIRARRSSERILADELDPSAAEPADDLLSARQDRAEVRRALDVLPEETREVVLLTYWEEWSSGQVGERLGLSDAAVRQRLRRAREALGVELEPRFRTALRRGALPAAVLLVVLAALPSDAAARPTSRSWRPAGVALVGVASVVAVWLNRPRPEVELVADIERVAPTSVTSSPVLDVPVPPVERGDESPPHATIAEAYAALAVAQGRVVVTCPAQGLPPDPEGPDDLRIFGSEVWFLADGPGVALVEPGVRTEIVSVDGTRMLTDTRASGAPAVLRWDDDGCTTTAARPVVFVVEAPPGVTVDGEGCRPLGPADGGGTAFRGYDGVPCRLDSRSETGASGWREVVVTEGLVVAAPDVVAQGSVIEIDVLALMGTALEESFGPDSAIAVALEEPGLSEEARALLLSWQDLSGAELELSLDQIRSLSEPE